MGKKEAFIATSGGAAAVSYGGYKLWDAYKKGQLDYLFKDKETVIPSEQELGITEADTIHGKEELDISFDPNVYQYYNDTCAIRSQQLVLQEYGIDVSQEELIEIAKSNGWYAEGFGTPMEDVGKLLEYFGVDAHASVGNNIFNLANELAQGHQIIVGVDSGELNNPFLEYGEDYTTGERADHALVVVGVDTSNPDDVKVIVTDPGNGTRQWAYSEQQFVDAWKDSNCFMTTTDRAPDSLSDFDFSARTEFAGIPKDTLSQLSNCELNMDSQDWDKVFDSIFENPEEWMSLIEQYPDAFDISEDDFNIDL